MRRFLAALATWGALATAAPPTQADTKSSGAETYPALVHSAELVSSSAVHNDRERARFAELIAAWSASPKQLRSAFTFERLADVAPGGASEAVEQLAKVGELRERDLAALSLFAAEPDLAELTYQLLNETDAVLSLAARPDADARAVELACETVLRRKGRVMDAVRQTLALANDRFEGEDRILVRKLASVRAQLSEYSLNADRAKLNTGVSFEELKGLEAELESAVGVAASRLAKVSAPITVRAVQAAIPADAVLIELVSFRPREQGTWGVPRYGAIVLTRDHEPRWVDLRDPARIGPAIDALTAALKDSRTEPKQAARELDELVLAPLDEVLRSARQVFISPDGPLNLIPFGTLVAPSGRYRIQDLTFTYLSSGRDLLAKRTHGLAREAPLIVAAPDFGRHQRKAKSGTRGVDMSKVYFPPLPGTAREAAAIRELLPRPDDLIGPYATETALKRVKGPYSLHLATHGFFVGADSLTAADSRGLMLKAASPAAAAPAGAATSTAAPTAPNPANALYSSGLALAGANTGRSDSDDGVLTALEASQLDLRGTRLVVLSACETAIGQAQVGEGVYGLRRSFVVAGAETLVMSLWKVDDEATSKLMTAYYSRLSHGAGRSAGLRDAQLALLGNTRTSHPYFWGAFIAAGNPSPLDYTIKKTKPQPSIAPGPRGCQCTLGGRRQATAPSAWLLLASLGLLRVRRATKGLGFHG